MCGLTGFIDRQGARRTSEAQTLIVNMTDTLAHRGPDQSGTWIDRHEPSSQMIALGHRRLSIQDVSEAGRQPMVSRSGRYVIAYNGEVYNAPALQNNLEALGHQFRGHSDTEVILAAIEQWGLNQTLQKLSGMFAIALWDSRDGILHLMRDRMGKKPLYVGWARDGVLLFGSELKALRAYPHCAPKINAAALHRYLQFAHIPAPLSIYEEFWLVPAGCSLTISTQDAQSDLTPFMEPYWHAAEAVCSARTVPFVGNDAQAVDAFEQHLQQAVSDRMLSDVPLGAFLSGGIDSSAVVAMLQHMSAQPVQSFTIGFEEDGFNEAGYAEKIAAHLGTQHHTHYITGKDAQDIIPSLPHMYDEPFADASALPTALLSHFTKQKVSVALSGDGGDEMFGGYNRHINLPPIANMLRFMPAPLRKGMAAGIAMASVAQWDDWLKPLRPQAGRAMHKVARLLAAGGRDTLYQTALSHWQVPPMSQDVTPLSRRVEGSDYMLEGLSYAGHLMLWDMVSYMCDGVLGKVDRASMAHALEVRAPFLDHRMMNFAWSLPMHMKIRDKSGKWIVREMLSRHIPRALWDRPKQGFTLPVAQWLRGDLCDWGGALLAQDHGLLDMPRVRQVWDAHQQGQGQHEDQLWIVLMFQAWAEKWM